MATGYFSGGADLDTLFLSRTSNAGQTVYAYDTLYVANNGCDLKCFFKLLTLHYQPTNPNCYGHSNCCVYYSFGAGIGLQTIFQYINHCSLAQFTVRVSTCASGGGSWTVNCQWSAYLIGGGGSGGAGSNAIGGAGGSGGGGGGIVYGQGLAPKTTGLNYTYCYYVGIGGICTIGHGCPGICSWFARSGSSIFLRANGGQGGFCAYDGSTGGLGGIAIATEACYDSLSPIGRRSGANGGNSRLCGECTIAWSYATSRTTFAACVSTGGYASGDLYWGGGGGAGHFPSGSSFAVGHGGRGGCPAAAPAYYGCPGCAGGGGGGGGANRIVSYPNGGRGGNGAIYIYY